MSTSSPKHDRDSDRESLTGWTLVDREGALDTSTTRGSAGKDDDKDSGKSSATPTKRVSALRTRKKEAAAKEKGEEKSEEKAKKKSEEKAKEKSESGCGTEEEEGEEELSEDLISMGKKVQEIKGESVKASSGSDSSDIETLDCPGPDDYYEDLPPGCSSLHSSLLSSSLSGFTFVGEADEGDVESLASSDVLVLDQEGKLADEETDLSLASCPSLPDDLPAIKPDTQYRHTPDRDLNSRLNIVVALTLACVLGLGLGHFVGWSSRSLWQENLNSAQVRRLRELQDDLMSCINTLPQEEPDSGGPEFIQSTSFIPVLPEGEAEGGANVETFVESLVVPLEEAGVVVDHGHQQHLQHGDVHHTHHTPAHSDAMEPTFATLDFLYGSTDPDPTPGQEQDARMHSGLLEPPLTSPTVAEDEIEPTQPQPPLSMKTIEPTLNDEVTSPYLAPQTNTLPPIELDSGLESFLAEEPEQPLLQDAAVLGEEHDSSVAVENSQIIEALNLENEELRSEVMRLQQENVIPFKIGGKDGKIARDLRERITNLLVDNEELRMAVAKQQFDGLPEGDSKAFNGALTTNYKLRLMAGKLAHLVPDITALKVSANDLQKENQELQTQVGKLRYQEQPLPQELNAMAREMESLKKVVDEAARKKKAPPNFENAKTYLSFMSQIKELSRPQNLARVSQETLSKMNRVIVNVVNKMKDIGQASIMKRGKASFDNTVASLAQSIAALGAQFDKTWNNLEAEVGVDDDSSELLQVDEGEEMDEEEGMMDDREGGAGNEPDNRGRETSGGKDSSGGPNEVQKTSGRSHGGEPGGDGGDGGDNEDDLDGEKISKVSAGKKEDKSETRRDKSRTRMTGKEDKKKEEQKEKKAKKKEEKAKKKKDKEDKKKKGKDGDKKEEKENYGGKKNGDWPRQSTQEEDKKYHRKQFNRYDNNKHHRIDDDNDDDDDDDDEKYKRKYQKKRQANDEEEDNKLKRKYQKKEGPEDDDDDDDDDDKKKGLLRHWEKAPKKNYRREYPGPKKAFIRRRGKNATRYQMDENGEWMDRRATGREVRRREEQKADWLFARAKHRDHKREEERKADWQFERAVHRKDMRNGGVEEARQGQLGDQGRFSHNRHDRRQDRRRFVRFDSDDDDDDDEFDDDYEFYDHPHHHNHHHQRSHHHNHHHQTRGKGGHKYHNNKGKREWVIPNFSATGKTYYY